MRIRTSRQAAACAALALLAAPPVQAQTREDLMAAHRGGTLRLVAHTAGGTIDPQINYTAQYWQLFQFVYDGLVTFKKAGGIAGAEIVPDLAEAIPAPQDEGKTYVFKLRDGIAFSDGSPVTVADVVASFPAHLQGLGAHLGHVLQRHRGGGRLPRHARGLHASGRRGGRRGGADRDLPPDPARPGVPGQDRGAACGDPAGIDARGRRGREADPGHRALRVHGLQPQRIPDDGAQPPLQGVERRRPARRLRRRHRLPVRPHRRGRGHGGAERAGRLDVRPAPHRPGWPRSGRRTPTRSTSTRSPPSGMRR